MDNLDINKPLPRQNSDEPIPFDDSDANSTNVSHSPLDLGGGAAVEVPKPKLTGMAVKPAVQKPVQKPAENAENIVSGDRITGIKTFFTKLHAGSLEFLDSQITRWLNENPQITIKRTNIATGEVVGKKTEPNIVITVWY